MTAMTQRQQKQSIHFHATNGGTRNMQQDYISDSLVKATHAVNQLQRDGFTVEKVELGSGQPRIKISYHYRCGVFGEPTVYSKGNNGQHYEAYVVNYEHCQLRWVRR